MKSFKSWWIQWICIGLFFFNTLPIFSQVDTTGLLKKIQDSVILLDGGAAHKAYGMYIAHSRDKKYMYILSANVLSIDRDDKIGVFLLNGKTKKHRIESFDTSEKLQSTIYKIKSSSKGLTTITSFPAQESLEEDSDIWALDKNLNQPGLVRFQAAKVISQDDTVLTFSGNLSNAFIGSPLFDSQGRILGTITDTTETAIAQKKPGAETLYNSPSISTLLGYATEALKDEDLYPVWKEVYPNQYIRNFVNESVALLLTRKGGAGIFLGWDHEQAGYILTAYHVVEEETGQFSIWFYPDYTGSGIRGEVLQNTIDVNQDLAIVKVDSCPTIAPVTFITDKELDRYRERERDLKLKIASIGYDKDQVDWQTKFGSLDPSTIIENKIETDLPLKGGDSGGPLFNDKGEVMGINLVTIKSVVDTLQQSIQSFSINSSTILAYLKVHASGIDFTEKWRFHDYPSAWKKYGFWLTAVGTALTAATVTYFVRRPGEEPDIEPPPGLPK